MGNGAVHVESGQVVQVVFGEASLRSLASQLGSEVLDLGEGILCPGLVNAHAHLELTGLGGRLSGSGLFADWIADLLRERAQCSQEDLRGAVEQGAEALLSSGCTCVGEISSLGVSSEWAVHTEMAARLYHECLDAGQPDRTGSAIEDLEQRLAATDVPGAISPHAPYSVSPSLGAQLATMASQRDLPVTVHWAESEEEQEYLLHGRGPLAEHLGPSPLRSGLDLLEDAGLLGPRTSLVHGNLPSPGDPERLAASGTSLIHCPGSHRFFGREPFALDDFRRAGVNLALGTDSLASNSALDMRVEMALMRQDYPGLDPLEVWRMATVGSARAIGMQGQVGCLAPGARADLVLLEVESNQSRALLDELTAGCPVVSTLSLAGRPFVISPPATSSNGASMRGL